MPHDTPDDPTTDHPDRHVIDWDDYETAPMGPPPPRGPKHKVKADDTRYARLPVIAVIADPTGTADGFALELVRGTEADLARVQARNAPPRVLLVDAYDIGQTYVVLTGRRGNIQLRRVGSFSHDDKRYDPRYHSSYSPPVDNVNTWNDIRVGLRNMLAYVDQLEADGYELVRESRDGYTLRDTHAVTNDDDE